jgi:hypothetical protein
MEIVVARYNEDISWLDGINFKKTIYNKGEDDIEGSIKLPNTGRETQTYFHHIVNNYDKLDDWTFFIQGNPFDHVRNMDWILENLPHTLNHSAKINIDNQVYFFSNGHFKRVLQSNSLGAPYHFTTIDIDGLWNQLFTTQPPQIYEFTAGCMFCVSKEKILKNDITFYKKCLDITETREKSPWEFERMMQYLFRS